MFPMKRGHHRLLLDPQKLAVRHCSRAAASVSEAFDRFGSVLAHPALA
jgi:hypothetical protein